MTNFKLLPPIFRLASRRRFLRGLCSVVLGSSASAVLAPIQGLARPASQAAVKALRAALEGTVVSASDENYEIHRLGLVWQMLKPRRYPAMIVQAASKADVIRTVKFARQQNYQVSIRSGGHNYVSSYLADGTLVLDIRHLQGIEVDPVQRTARIGPAVYGSTLTKELEKHGFSFPVPHPGKIPMGGYLLGGGQGWNGQAWGGAACLNIEEVEVVTAEGCLVTANKQQNTDLYWAARGAGPCFFGVVTSFTLKLYDEPGTVLRSTYTWPVKDAVEVSAWAYKKAMEMPSYVETWFFFVAAPRTDTDNGHVTNTDSVCIVQSCAFASNEAAARAALAPLTQADEALEGKCLDKHEYENTSITALQDETDTVSLPWHHAVDNMWTDHPPQAYTAELIEHMAKMPSDLSAIVCVLKPHDEQRPGDHLPMLGKTYFLCFNVWTDPEQTQANIEWRDQTMVLVEPYGKGHYISEANFLARPSRAENSFTEGSWQKLRTLRDKYDPGHLFYTQLD